MSARELQTILQEISYRKIVNFKHEGLLIKIVGTHWVTITGVKTLYRGPSENIFEGIVEFPEFLNILDPRATFNLTNRTSRVTLMRIPLVSVLSSTALIIRGYPEETSTEVNPEVFFTINGRLERFYR